MRNVGIKYGLICGLVYIIFGMGQILLGAQAQGGVTGILLGLGMLVATFFVIFYGVKEFRDNVNGGGLTTGQGVKLGVLIALIASVLTAVFNLFYHYVIDPELMERMLETMREGYEERGMTDQQIEQAVKWVEMFRNPALGAGFTIVWYCLWGLVKGLIAGAILKHEPAPAV